ncbi:MAG: glycosyltransferase family 39 protein [Candidatus Omnitrophota bacterium]|nr:glycosyltransferase family 39 protein [Candidatus Omnitrophota bacterium]
MKRKEVILILIIIIIVTIGLCYEISQPWVGLFDFNGTVYSRFAKNFLTFGFLKTKMSPTWDMGSVAPQNFDYYLHHPPMVAYLVAISFKLFGIHEWSARIVPIIFSVLALILFYLIVRSYKDKIIALLSLVFLGFTPMFLYYGRMVNHEPVFLFFYFLIMLLYLKYLDKRKILYLVGIIASFILAYLTAWATFYFSILLLIHYLIFGYKNIKDKRLIVMFSLLPVIFALIYIFWIYSIKGSLSDNINSIISRFGPNKIHQFTWTEFLLLEGSRIKFLFTPVISFLALWSIVSLAVKRSLNLFWKEGFIIIFLSLPLVNVLLFREGAWEHDYQLYYFLPFFSIVSAAGLLSLGKILHNKRISQILILSFIILFLIQSYLNFSSLHSFKFDISHKIAVKINSVSRLNEEIGVNFRLSVPTSWYVDRKYTVIKSIEEFEKINAVKKLSLMIVIPQEENTGLVKFLSSRYTYFTYNNFIFFDLK